MKNLGQKPAATTKGLFKLINDTMHKLDKNEIEITKAKTQSNLAKTAVSIMALENDKLRVIIEASAHNHKYGTDYQLTDLDQD